MKFCSLYYINGVAACDAGIIDSAADFEDGRGGSEFVAVLRGKVGLHRWKCLYCMNVGRRPLHHTILICSCCKVCLGKVSCFEDFHWNK